MILSKIASGFFKTVTLSWLTGPIVDKELRISSRRKRNYVLRSVYLAVILLIIILFWAEEISGGSTNVVYQASRLSRAGLMITGIVMMCQFYAVQVISAIMLSNSISDEIDHKTLGVLMSTPITSLQIVAGKLISKLLQVLLLMTLTLPILGIIRVFGGVPWEFLLNGFCVTLTAVFFAALISLNLSIHNRHSYMVIIISGVLLFFLYVVVPAFSAWIAIEGFDVNEDIVLKWISVTNPLMMMFVMMEELFNPRGMPVHSSGWYLHCLLMLFASLVLFIRAVIIVRKKALLQACGEISASGGRKKTKNPAAMEKVRHIKGSPLLWKELRASVFNIGPIKKIILLILLTGSILFSYYIFASERDLDEEYVHVMYGIVFMLLGAFFTTVFAATCITTEKNNQSWPILLCTLLTNRQIITAKAMGVLRRSAVVWSLLLIHILIFSVAGYIHPVVLIHVLLIIIPVIIFMTSSGVLISSLFKHTSNAVIANLIFIAMLWGGIPLLTAILSAIAGANDDLMELIILLNPFYHIGMALEGGGGASSAMKSLMNLRYYWLEESYGIIPTTIILCVIGTGYLIVSYIFLQIATLRVRDRIF